MEGNNKEVGKQWAAITKINKDTSMIQIEWWAAAQIYNDIININISINDKHNNKGKWGEKLNRHHCTKISYVRGDTLNTLATGLCFVFLFFYLYFFVTQNVFVPQNYLLGGKKIGDKNIFVFVLKWWVYPLFIARGLIDRSVINVVHEVILTK